jgi:hypothetical protein
MGRRGGTLGLAGILCLLGTVAQAQVVTIDGTDFNVTYNEADLGLFGTPNLVGDDLFFTPNSFVAQSVNGQGTVQTTSTANITLTAHPGFNFGALSLSEFGDYQLQGPGSTVSVGGELFALDFSNPTNPPTTGIIATNPSLPLTVDNGTTNNWAGSAVIDNSTPPTIGGTPWLASATEVDLDIENILTAYTTPCSGACPEEQAFIQKKLANLQPSVELAVTPVPLPPAVAEALSGFGALVLLAGLTRRSSRLATGSPRV